MNVLVIGYGSIGKRHYEVLRDLDAVQNIDVVTRQAMSIQGSQSFRTIQDVKRLAHYDYFVIANETYRHYTVLHHLVKQVSGKKILVEKPLFEKCYDLELNHNQVYVAYNLRYHPLIQWLKNELSEEKVLYANVIAGQYLPTWRPDQDYTKSYSAFREKGGGVLRDLSHEIDYIGWLFGKIGTIASINTKISDLDIQSDDLFTAIGTTQKNTVVNLTIDYLSKTPLRQLVIHMEDRTVIADMISGRTNISSADQAAKEIQLDAVDRNFTYTRMHEDLLLSQAQHTCSYEEGLQTIELIDSIELIELKGSHHEC